MSDSPAPTQDNDKLFEFVMNLWEKSEDKSEFVQKCYDYWDGKQTSPAANTLFFSDQNKSANNIVNEIIETRISSMLDAQFRMSVVPALNPFSDLTTIQEQQSVADIYDQEMQNVVKVNRFDDQKEKVARWGDIAGFGASQTTFEALDDNPEGQIKILVLNPKKIRFDRSATEPSSLSIIAYEKELPPSAVKKLYGKNPDGTWNEDLCDKIDDVTESTSETKKGERRGLVSVSTTVQSELAYAREGKNISAGKIVKMVVMFVLDDSIYAPEKKDTTDEKAVKAEGEAQYPNGRMIIFVPKREKKLILDDRPAPKGFKGLGNIDFYNPIDFDELTGKSMAAWLMPIQDRINGTQMRIRQLIQDHLHTVVINKNKFPELKEGDFTRFPVTFSDGEVAGDPFVLSNNNIEEAMKLVEYSKALKQFALDMARLNETMINGVRQEGTTSADQVEALNESPMASIRMLQKNFKDYMIRIGEKIITLIHEYYSLGRLTKLATGVDGAAYAQFNENDQGRFIELFNEAGKTVKTLKVNPDWKFCVEVTAGTEIPRSRRENAALTQQLYSNGVLGDPQQTDTKEKLLTAIDYPHRREVIAELKKKDEVAAQTPPSLTFIQVLQNPELAKGVGDILKSLQGYSKATGEILQTIGLSPDPDTMETAPVQHITSKAAVEDVSAITPSKISPNPQEAAKGQEIAAAIIDSKRSKIHAI